MAQECGFFNARLVDDNFDRVYLAEQFAAYFAAFIGNGIYGKSMQRLQVLCQNTPNMSIKVLSGEAYINGWWYRNTDTYNIQVPIADGVLSRIDVVVVRWGNSERDMWLQLITGTPSVNPVKPAIRRDADYYDLQLAVINVSAGSIRIVQSQIQDTRLDNSVCGLVTGVVDQIDTTNLYNQFEAYFKEFKERYEADYDKWTKEQKQAYIDFITNSKNDYDNWTAQQTQAYLDYINKTKADYDEWVANRQDSYDQWTANKILEYTQFVNNSEQNYNEYITNKKDAYDSFVSQMEDDYNQWVIDRREEYWEWYRTHTEAWTIAFTEWFESIKNKLSDDVAGSLQLQIDELNAMRPTVQVADITHNLNAYVHCDLFETTYACGVQGAGEGPCGGGSIISSSVEYEMADKNHIKVKAIEGFGDIEQVIKLDNFMYTVLFIDNFKSLVMFLDDRK